MAIDAGALVPRSTGTERVDPKQLRYQNDLQSLGLLREELMMKKDEALKDLMMQKSELEELEREEKRKFETTEETPEAYLDLIARWENKKARLSSRYSALQKDVADYKLMRKAEQEKLGEAQKVIAEIETVTGQRLNGLNQPAEPVMPQRGPRAKGIAAVARLSWAEQDFLVKELEDLKARVTAEQVKSREIIKHKQALISRLSRTKFDVEEMQEKVYEKQNTINTQELELAKLIRQKDLLKSEHKKSDHDIERLKLRNQDGVDTEDSLKRDKDFLLRQKNREAEENRRQTEMIRAQQKRERELQERLAAITDAMHDMKVNKHKEVVDALNERENPDQLADYQPPRDTADVLKDERIPVALYEFLARNKANIDTTIEHKRVLLLEKDGTIEATGEKLKELIDQNDEDLAERVRDVKNLETQVRELNDGVWQDRLEYRRAISGLDAERLSLHRNLAGLKATPETPA